MTQGVGNLKLFPVSKESNGLQLWHEEGLKVPSKRPGKKHCYKEKVMECSLGVRRDLYVTKCSFGHGEGL
jgi:hypothetical protein